MIMQYPVSAQMQMKEMPMIAQNWLPSGLGMENSSYRTSLYIYFHTYACRIMLRQYGMKTMVLVRLLTRLLLCSSSAMSSPSTFETTSVKTAKTAVFLNAFGICGSEKILT